MQERPEKPPGKGIWSHSSGKTCEEKDISLFIWGYEIPSPEQPEQGMVILYSFYTMIALHYIPIFLA